jgi:predicted  nucleic acid-binding Zn-ribbon protein
MPQQVHALRSELQAAEQKLHDLREENTKLATKLHQLEAELKKAEKKYQKAMNIAERALAELKGR